jgi:hypothetical protein
VGCRGAVAPRAGYALVGLLAAIAGLPAAAGAWPAIQDDAGLVYLCDGRPIQRPDGAWSCRSGPGFPAGALVDVVRPGSPPGSRPWDASRGAPYRYVPYPWGPPPREPSGYDALDPWLGPRGGTSER